VATGHRLQLRLTSTDVPTHLPGTIDFDRTRPQEARIDLLQPATNTVRLGQSRLNLSVLGAAAGPGGPASCAPRPRASVSRIGLRTSRRRGPSFAGRAVAFRCTSSGRRAGRVDRVRVSLARVNGGRCRFVGRSGRLGGRRSCSRPAYVNARLGRPRAGKVPWTLRVRRALPRGRYVVRVVARDADGRSSSRGRQSVRRFKAR
jgi:hypothetical protein